MTPDSPRKSSALSTLSKVKQSVSLAKSALSSATSPDQIAALSKTLRNANALLSNLKIETVWAQASDLQVESAEAFHNRDADVYCFIGGNRSGKSICAGWMCFGQHLRDVARDGEIYWCVAPTIEKSISGQQKELWSCLPRRMFGSAVYDARNGFGGQRPAIVLNLPSGGTAIVRFKTAAQYDSDPASFEQEKLAGIWIDETVQEGIYDRLVARVLDLNGFILVSTIPDADWMSERFEESRDHERVFFRKFKMRDNAHNLGENALERAKASWSDEEYQMRVEGDFRFLSGRVYKEFIRAPAPAGHLCRPFNIPEDWPRYRGLDWGNRHPTVCLWVALSPNDTAYVYDEYYQTDKAVQVHAARILDKSRGQQFRGPVICDPALYKRDQANVQSIASEFEKFGLKCRPARRASQEFSEWAQVQIVKKWLMRRMPTGPALQVFDTCRNLISDLWRWKYKEDREHKPLDSDTFEDKNNDGCDALRYILTSNPSWGGQIVQVRSTLND